MNYKALLYVFCILLSMFSLGSIKFDNILKSKKIWEARILVVIMGFIIGYLLTNFITDFLECSKII